MIRENFRWLQQPRPKVEPVDFSHIPPEQDAMHGRLLNWGRACHGGASIDTAPMFRLAKSADKGGYGAATVEPVDREDAHQIGLAVYMLPEPHRVALHWYYVKRTSVAAGCRALSVRASALALYVIDGRRMLVNRGV